MPYSKTPFHSSGICLDQANSRESDDINLIVLLGREDYCNSAGLRLHLKHTGPTPGWNKGSVSECEGFWCTATDSFTMQSEIAMYQNFSSLMENTKLMTTIFGGNSW